MNRILILAVFVLVVACGGPGEVEGTGDLTGYTLTEVPGTEYTKAVKLDGSEVMLEQGFVRNGVREGTWMTFQRDGVIESIDYYINGKLNGISLTFDNRGQINSRTGYVNNTMDGMKATYRFGRPLEIIPYDNGEINGQVRKYYNNGKIREEIDYKDGVQDGYYRHYNEEGQIDLEYVYKNGEKVSGGIVTPSEEEQ